MLKADAIREATGADVGLVGALVPGPNRWGGFLTAGPVTLNDLATTHMFPDYIMTCTATGRQLKGILARSTASTVLRSKADPAYTDGALALADIRDDRVYTVAADYASCSGVLSYRADTSTIEEDRIVFKDPASFHGHPALSLPCSELRQTDIEVTEALAACIEKRGRVRVRGLTGDLRYYVTNPAVHHCAAYDWAHITFSVPLTDPTRRMPRLRRETLGIALARPGFNGGAARENATVLLKFTEAAPCTANLAGLDQKLPVTVKTGSKRFAVAGSCSTPAHLKLVPPGGGTAGEAVIVTVTLINRGDADVTGLVVLSPPRNTRLHGSIWPDNTVLKRNRNLPALLGLYSTLGHHKRPYQQGGVFLATASRLDRRADILAVPGTGYNKGLVGLKKPVTVGAGRTETLSLVFLAANADNPEKPATFDFAAVITALKDQLERETGPVRADQGGDD